MHGRTETPDQLKQRGCICEFGCSTCGLHESGMGNCPSFDRICCRVGREPNDECPLSSDDELRRG